MLSDWELAEAGRRNGWPCVTGAAPAPELCPAFGTLECPCAQKLDEPCEVGGDAFLLDFLLFFS